MTNTKKYNLIKAIITLIIGMILIIFKTSALKWLLTVVGLMFLFDGIINIIQNQKKEEGIGEIIGGLVIIILGWLLIKLAVTIAGVVLLIYGVYMLIKLISTHTKAIDMKQNIMLYSTPVIYIIGGGLLCFAQNATTQKIVVFVGILLVVNGIINIIKENHNYA